MSSTTKEPSLANSAKVTDTRTAYALCNRLQGVISDLEYVVSEETDLARRGALDAIAAIQARKKDLIGKFTHDMNRVITHGNELKSLAPRALAELGTSHERLKGIMATNMAVLATAQAVADGLVNAISEIVGATRRAQIYGPQGQAPSSPTAQDGLSLNRAV